MQQQQQCRSDNGSATLKSLLEAYERQLIQSALAASAGNQRRAAASLGVLPTTLHEKMKRLGLLRRPAPTQFSDHVPQSYAGELAS
jgi:DNA-binding NtrC family response regulator